MWLVCKLIWHMCMNTWIHVNIHLNRFPWSRTSPVYMYACITYVYYVYHIRVLCTRLIYIHQRKIYMYLLYLLPRGSLSLPLSLSLSLSHTAAAVNSMSGGRQMSVPPHSLHWFLLRRAGEYWLMCVNLCQVQWSRGLHEEPSSSDNGFVRNN